MSYLAKKRWTGTFASLAAAYALVLHVVLSSFAMAAMSPAAAASGGEICISHVDAVLADADTGKVKGKPVVRCPLCVGSHASAMPPGQQAVALLRFAIAVDRQALEPAGIRVAAATSTHPARGPPHVG